MKINVFENDFILTTGNGITLKNDIPNCTNEIDFNGKLTPNRIKDSIENTIGINFEVTEKCNLDCYYCAYGELYGHFGNRKDVDLDIQLAINLLDYINETLSKNADLNKGKPFYIGFYGGEPTLQMHIIKKIISYVELNFPQNISVVYSMTTNGILLKKHIEYIASKKFKLLISLDGNKFHNSYRLNYNGENSFDIVYNNIKYIQNNFKEYFCANVKFNSVIHNRNTPEEVLNFFKKEFNKETTLSDLNESGVEECKNNDFKILKGTNNSQLSKEDFYNFIKISTNTIFKNYIDLFYDHWTKRQVIPTATCTPFSRRIHMCTDGLLFPCEKIGKEFPLGKVTKEKVEINFQEICDKINPLLDKIKQQCSICTNRFNCKQCLFRFIRDGSNLKCPDFSTNNSNQQCKILEEFTIENELFKELIENYNEL